MAYTKCSSQDLANILGSNISILAIIGKESLYDVNEFEEILFDAENDSVKAIFKQDGYTMWFEISDYTVDAVLSEGFKEYLIKHVSSHEHGIIIDLSKWYPEIKEEQSQKGESSKKK